MAKNVKSAKQGAAASSGDVDAGKACAALSYILVGIIWFFADEKMRSNRFAKFHAKQGLVLLILALAIGIIERILVSIFFNPFNFSTWNTLNVLGTVFRIIWLAELVLVIIGIVNAVNGKERELPVIGGFGSKFTF